LICIPKKLKRLFKHLTRIAKLNVLLRNTRICEDWLLTTFILLLLLIPYKNATEPKNGELGDWLLNFLKEFRNWIHPGKKIKDYTRMRVTKKRFEVDRELVDETINLLLNKVENDLKKEFEKL